MSKLSRIAGWNLLIFLSYWLLAYLLTPNKPSYEGMDIVFVVGASAVQVLVNFVLMSVAFGTRKNELGKAYLLSALLIMFVGTTYCFGSLSIWL